VVVIASVARRFMVLFFRAVFKLLGTRANGLRTCRPAGADGTRDRRQDRFSKLKLCPPMGLGLLRGVSGDFGTSPFLSRSRVSLCSPWFRYVGCRDRSTMAHRKIKSRLRTLQACRMPGIQVPDGPDATFNLTITLQKVRKL
jgi:hypothetical protein